MLIQLSIISPEQGGGYSLLAKIASRFIRVIYACDIPLYNNHLGKGCVFAHNALGVVISREAIIGDHCVIYQHVTIGAGKDGGYPKIGNNVTIYANAVIVGNITIGDNAVIGANAFVNSNVPPNAVYAGVPAKPLR